MKYINLILIVFLLLGCSKEEEKGQFEPVIVSEVVIPTSANIGVSIPIQVRAYAPNGCWSNLQINLTKSQANHYQITATGFNNGNIVCPDVLVGKVTTFNLIFSEAGEYYFQSNKTPFTILYDTIRVNN